MTTGLMAGVFGLYQHTVMVGLGRSDDRTFIGGFQALDRAILNPWFLFSFVGALVFTAVAAFLNGNRRILPWVLAALILYVIVFGITVAVNVPLNDALKAAGDPFTMADPAAVREAFHEARWTAWNLVRTIATTAAFGFLCWALVARGEAG
ncbi:DUF1772 domain-containing protein [Actinoplanes sp. LDG1-06]|uniref:DUF1772 domain-containing protein n=2 Tax=Paractinoplanes ovalisporus TaxID=2810368 RepID=A0ABS2A9H9_9ACTN|nr:DUF1772 domain-containing protein [Actinoplanes ovalisporus]